MTTLDVRNAVEELMRLDDGEAQALENRGVTSIPDVSAVRVGWILRART